MKKIILNLSILGCLFSLVGCGETPIEIDPNHNFTYKVTDSNFIEEGHTDYKIIIPEECGQPVKYACDELKLLFAEGTGVNFVSETDGNKAHSDSQHYISLGNTSLLSTTEFAKEVEKLPRDGSRIVTKDNNIYIFGSNDNAVLYGAYNFLNLYLNFETFTAKRYVIDKGVKDLKLYDFDVTDNPDIAFRQRRGVLNPTTTDHDDVMFAYRLRALDKFGDLFLPIHKSDSRTSNYDQCHNSFFYFPIDQYYDSHPEFYAASKSQLCFTAHGNTESYNLMVKLASEKIIQSLKWYTPELYPNYVAVQFGINDNWNMCTCSDCTHIKETHNGTDAAAVIIFLKRVGKLVNEWMDKPENSKYKRDLRYMFLAYQSTLTPPFSDPENIPEDIALHDGDPKIAPYVALSGCDETRTFSDANNVTNRKNVELWGTAYPGSFAWCYGGFFSDYLSFFDLYSFYSDYHSYLKKFNYSFTFEQIIDYQRGATTGFYSLADYVTMKKAWNNSLNVNTLIENYLHGVYGQAYSAMKEIFTQWRLWFAKLQYKESWGQGCNQLSVSDNPKYWSIGFIKQMLALFDKAYDLITVYAGDQIEYNKYKDCIDMEILAIIKPIIDNFTSNFSSEDVISLKAKFKEIVNRLGVQYIREQVLITSYIDKL